MRGSRPGSSGGPCTVCVLPEHVTPYAYKIVLCAPHPIRSVFAAPVRACPALLPRMGGVSPPHLALEAVADERQRRLFKHLVLAHVLGKHARE
jgi:hypothetical protein